MSEKAFAPRIAPTDEVSPAHEASRGASAPGSAMGKDDLESIRKLRDGFDQIKKELARVIVGQDQVIEELLIALFSRGHCLLEGVPGLAKTLMISTLSRTLSLSFSRIQFTPDLMPADITGTEILAENRSTGAREFRFLEGPLFANVILADEINRTPHDHHSVRSYCASVECRRDHPPAKDRSRSAGHRPRDSLRLVTGPSDAHSRAGRSGIRLRPGLVGRRTSGRAELDSGRQSSGP